MKWYTDTSFLVSLYSSDAHSTRADLWRQAHPEPLPFTPLHRLEMRNALWQSAFQKKRTASEVQADLQQLAVDAKAGLLLTPTVSFDDIWQLAESLADKHTLATGARSLDILHLAAAIWLQAGELVTFDQRQAALALRAGCKVAVV